MSITILTNILLKDYIVRHSNNSDNTDVLENALETKFAVLNEPNNTLESFVQHLEEQKQTNQQQNHNNSGANSNDNNSVSNNANRNSTHNEQNNGCMNNYDHTQFSNFQQQNQAFNRYRVRFEDNRQRI